MSQNSLLKPILQHRKTRVANIRQALNGAIAHLTSERMPTIIAEIFHGDPPPYGPDPVLSYTITIRRDAADPTKLTYIGKTKVTHDVGDGVKFHGLEL